MNFTKGKHGQGISISINGIATKYDRICSTTTPSETLIFLHGWSGSSESWKPNVEKLSSLYDCIVINIPGFGISSEPTKVWGIQEYAEFVKDFTQHLELQKFVIVGKSFGGRIAIYYASKWSESLSHLVLVSPAGVEKKGITTRLKIFLAKSAKALLQLAGKTNLKKRVEKVFLKVAGINKDSDYKWEVKKLVTNTDLTEESSQISIPTLIVWGNNDRTLPIKWGKVLNQKIKGSRLKQIPGGHAAHIESANEFNELVKAFLSNQERLV